LSSFRIAKLNGNLRSILDPDAIEEFQILKNYL
jgi:hypothetical protein